MRGMASWNYRPALYTTEKFEDAAAATGVGGGAVACKRCGT